MKTVEQPNKNKKKERETTADRQITTADSQTAEESVAEVSVVILSFFRGVQLNLLERKNETSAAHAPLYMYYGDTLCRWDSRSASDRERKEKLIRLRLKGQSRGGFD